MSIPKLQNILEQKSHAAVADSDKICDERFIDQLREIQNLKQFLFEEKVKFEPTQLSSIDLGSLNNLRFSPDGRMASLEESGR